MEVKIYYMSGRVGVFSTSTFATLQPWPPEGSEEAKAHAHSLMSESQLHLENITRDGIYCDLIYHSDLAPKEQKRSFYEYEPYPGKTAKIEQTYPFVGRRLIFADADEVQEIAYMTIDGEVILWRQGDDLINANKFRNAEFICYSSQVAASVNNKVVALYFYLKTAHPELSDEEIASRLGYTWPAILQVMDEEQKNTIADAAATQDTPDNDLEALPPAQAGAVVPSDDMDAAGQADMGSLFAQQLGQLNEAPTPQGE
jgi:hypothetical protein